MRRSLRSAPAQNAGGVWVSTIARDPSATPASARVERGGEVGDERRRQRVAVGRRVQRDRRHHRRAMAIAGRSCVGVIGGQPVAQRVERVDAVDRPRVPEQEAFGAAASWRRRSGPAPRRRRRPRRPTRSPAATAPSRRRCPATMRSKSATDRRDDVGGLAHRVGHAVLAGAPVRRVHHRRHVVDDGSEQADVLRRRLGPGGRDAEHRDARARRPLGLEGVVGVGDERAIDTSGAVVQPGKLISRGCPRAGGRSRRGSRRSRARRPRWRGRSGTGGPRGWRGS